ncbi:hypothetical protein EDC01DRAFT_376685 [Geopyxis carbonaria]|nr:hypothetical protein EDC01DRAFT_376685 [Geopyxis carbonaria]
MSAEKKNTSIQVKSLEDIYTVQLDEQEATVKTQKAKIEALEKQLSEELAKERTEKESAIKELEDLSRQMAASTAENESALRAAKEQLEVAIKEHEAALETANKGHTSVLEATLNDNAAKLVEASKEKESAINSLMEKTAAEKSEVESELKSIQENLSATIVALADKEAALEKSTAENGQLEQEIPELKQKLALAESMAREKEAAVDGVKKEAAARLRVLEAELAEARLGKTAATVDRDEVSKSTGDEKEPHPDGHSSSEESVLRRVRHPVFFSWPRRLAFAGVCLPFLLPWHQRSFISFRLRKLRSLFM